MFGVLRLGPDDGLPASGTGPLAADIQGDWIGEVSPKGADPL
jgi:hypothetical protein